MVEEREKRSIEYSSKGGFIPVEGGRVWYEMKGRSDGFPLVFLHGGPGFPPYNFACLEGLGDTRPVVLYHQLGCGKSDRPDNPELWTLNRFVDELKTVKDTLKIDRFHLMGHSWGAALAAEYALKYPEGIESLILASPLLSSPRWIEDANRLKRTLPENIQKIIEESESENKTDTEDYKNAMDEFYKRYWIRITPLPESVRRTSQEANLEVYTTMWGPSEFYCTGSLRDFDCTERLKELKMPVMFTCGRHDEATPETTSYFQSLVPDSRMVIFENSAHHAELEERDVFLLAVANFLGAREK